MLCVHVIKGLRYDQNSQFLRNSMSFEATVNIIFNFTKLFSGAGPITEVAVIWVDGFLDYYLMTLS
jgi:hypothetical protein